MSALCVSPSVGNCAIPELSVRCDEIFCVFFWIFREEIKARLILVIVSFVSSEEVRGKIKRNSSPPYRTGKSPTLNDLDQLRQRIYRDVAAGKGGDKAFGNMMAREVDNVIDNAGPKNMVAGSADEAYGAIKEARDLHKRYSNAAMLEKALDKARRDTAVAGKGGNINNNMRRELNRILNSDKKSKYLTKEQRSVFEDAIEGTNAQNALRHVGGLSPMTGSLSTMLTLGASAYNPAFMIPALAGSVAKRAADKGTKRSVDMAKALLAHGKKPNIKQLTATQRKIIELLMQGNAPVTAPLTEGLMR